MNRQETLDAASQCVLSDRNKDYGSPEDNFRTTAVMWQAYLQASGRPVTLEPHDVAAMMALLKLARIATSPAKADHWVDMAGYAACGAECATREQP